MLQRQTPWLYIIIILICAPPFVLAQYTPWPMHHIDADLLSAHGFEFTDIDQDGNRDFIVCNADWDTPDHKDVLLWYENPGISAAQTKLWARLTVHKSLEYYSKTQVAVEDINGDGLVDAVTQTDNRVIVHLKKSNKPVEWNHMVVQKPAETRWVPRPIALAVLNMDGKLDILGMLIHNYGNTPMADKWQTHPIKWSDGVYSGKRYQGEKWDHIRIVDIDRDGDPDILASCEEHYHMENGEQVIDIGVVWFENPL